MIPGYKFLFWDGRSLTGSARDCKILPIVSIVSFSRCCYERTQLFDCSYRWTKGLGDILFAKITPCMENGKIAIARKLDHGFGFGSTVICPSDNYEPLYLWESNTLGPSVILLIWTYRFP